MNFPVTVALNTRSAERPGTYGPYVSGTNLYMIIVNAVGDTRFLSVYKSSDSGETWSEQDSADRPQPDFVTNASVAYTCCQSSVDEKIYVVYVASGFTTIQAFDPDTDTWGAVLATTIPTNGAYPISSMNGFYVAVYRASDNSVIVALPSEGVILNGVFHFIPCFSVFNIGSATWGAWTATGFEDYADIADWSLVPCGMVIGSDGVVRLFSQQVSHIDALTPDVRTFDTTTTFTVPDDCFELINIETWGAGAGESPGVTTDGFRGGGGGGAYSKKNSLVVTPGQVIDITVGLGGVSGASGGNTSVASGTVIAAGGSVGLTSNGGQGGQASASTGDVKFSGGDGGRADHTSGGGGGGSATSIAPGGNGQDGQIASGGNGGTGQGPGGSGGAVGLPGSSGTAPGGGSGGAGVGPTTHTQTGANGFVSLEVVHHRTSPNGRLFQQAINANNSLGTLAEITQGTFPIQATEQLVIPFTFDCKSGPGYVAICMTGVNATGNDNFLSGRGSNADPISFSLTSFSSGNGGNGIDASPCLAVNGATVYTIYRSVSSPPSALFRYRINGGDPIDIGSFADGFCRVAASFTDVLLVTFGTPSTAVRDAVAPG